MYKTHPPPLNIFSPLIYILYSNASIACTMFTLSFVTIYWKFKLMKNDKVIIKNKALQ